MSHTDPNFGVLLFFVKKNFGVLLETNRSEQSRVSFARTCFLPHRALMQLMHTSLLAAAARDKTEDKKPNKFQHRLMGISTLVVLSIRFPTRSPQTPQPSIFRGDRMQRLIKTVGILFSCKGAIE